MAKRKPGSYIQCELTLDTDNNLNLDEKNTLSEIMYNKISELSDGGIARIADAPGSGKTYSTGKLIIRLWKEGKFTWVATESRNNRDNGVEKVINEAKKTLSLKESSDLEFMTIVVKSTEDCWKDYLNKVEKGEIERAEDSKYATAKLKEEIGKAKERYRELESLNRNVPDYVRRNISDRLTEADYKVRGELREIMKSTNMEDVDFIRENEWISVLYPFAKKNISINGKRPIVFSTIAKTIYPADDLHGDTSILAAQIRNSKDSVVIIDEIDQSKKAFQDQLIKDDFYNMVIVANNLYWNFTYDRLKEVIEAENDIAKHEVMKEKLNEIEKIRKDLEKKYRISDERRDFSAELREKDEAGKSFILELAERTITAGKPLYLKKGHNAPNVITEDCEGDGDKNESLHKMVNDISKTLISKCVAASPLFLVALRQKRKKEEAYEEGNINSFLGLLGFHKGSRESEYYRKRMLDKSATFKSKETSLYSHGISFIYPSMDDNNSEINTLQAASVNTTPEAILAGWAENHPVLGISASADIESVLCNYNYDWIRKQGIKVIDITPEEKSRLEEDHKKRFEYSSLCKFEALPLRMSDITDHDIIEEINKLSDGDVKKFEEVDKPRYLKIISALVKFQEKDAFGHCAHKAGLILTFPDFSDKEQEKVITKIYTKYLKGDKNEIVFSNANKFYKTIKAAGKDLAKGKRKIIFCTYKGGSTGLDYNYKVKDPENYCKITNEPRDTCVDFDFLGLSDIRNIFPSFKHEDGKLVDAEKTKLYLSYNLSEIYETGEISEELRDRTIKYNVFRGLSISSELQMSLPSTQNYILKEMLQSTGRMERSKYKWSQNTVVYDDRLAEFLTEDVLDRFADTHNINPLFREFAKSVKEIRSGRNTGIVSKETIINNKLTMASRRIARTINNMYGKTSDKNPYTEEKMMAKRELEEFTKKHPTANEEDFDQHEWIKKFYLKAKTIYFKNDSPYDNWEMVDVSVEMKPGYEKLTEKSARLPEILKIHGIEDINVYKRFEDKGYALSWDENNEYIMSPALMNNIYKGTIGEEAGKELLKYAEPKNIVDPAIYELFDFVASGVLIDTKNYKPGVIGINDNEQKINIADMKMSMMDANACVYISLFDKGERKTEEIRTPEGRHVLISSDICDIDTGKIKESSYNEVLNYILHKYGRSS